MGRKPLDEGADMMGLLPGDYGLAADGKWYARPPLVTGDDGDWPKGFPPAQLVQEIEEHADGTITADPSIIFSSGAGVVWHGYLRAGA